MSRRMKRIEKHVWTYAFRKSVPIVYTGAFQFILISFFNGAASPVTIAMTAFLMNSRQVFYSLTFLKDFSEMGHRKLYMIHTMTDETYAVNCTIELSGQEKEDAMFLVAFISRCSWMAGAVAGGLAGQLLPFDMEGIDFCMTALFVLIFLDQWEKAKSHAPALAGLGAGILCLAVFGKNRFMLPALFLASGFLVVHEKKEDVKP